MQTFLTTSSRTIFCCCCCSLVCQILPGQSDIVDKKSNMSSFASMSLISFLKKPSLLIYLNSHTCSMVSNLLKLKNNSLSGSPHCRRLTFVKFFVVFLAKKSQRMVFLALFCPKIYPYFLSRVIILYTFAFLF